jgi:hypothetical protein
VSRPPTDRLRAQPHREFGSDATKMPWVPDEIASLRANPREAGTLTTSQQPAISVPRYPEPTVAPADVGTVADRQISGC